MREGSIWQGSYGKEPFDLRLSVLRLMRQWKVIAIAVLAGAFLVSGAHWADLTLFAGEKQYRAKSLYRMDYSVEGVDAYLMMLNSYTWNTYVHTEEFLGYVRARLAGSPWERMDDEELGSCIQGDMESDQRVPHTVVVTREREKSTAIAEAVEGALESDFAAGISEIREIRVIDHAGEAQEVLPDLRIGRAAILGAVLGCFFAIIILLLKELGDDSIWLPATIRHRYGIPAAGTAQSRDLKENICYLFSGRRRIAVCTLQAECDPAETADLMKRVCADTDLEAAEWIAMPSLLLCPETVRGLREAEGILLAVKAGAHAGKQMEYALDYLRQQNCEITAVILMGADERLLRCYYGFGRLRKEATP